jgi:hypothetical protein
MHRFPMTSAAACRAADRRVQLRPSLAGSYVSAMHAAITNVRVLPRISAPVATVFGAMSAAQGASGPADRGCVRDFGPNEGKKVLVRADPETPLSAQLAMAIADRIPFQAEPGPANARCVGSLK